MDTDLEIAAMNNTWSTTNNTLSLININGVESSFSNLLGRGYQVETLPASSIDLDLIVNDLSGILIELVWLAKRISEVSSTYRDTIALITFFELIGKRGQQDPGFKLKVRSPTQAHLRDLAVGGNETKNRFRQTTLPDLRANLKYLPTALSEYMRTITSKISGSGGGRDRMKRVRSVVSQINENTIALIRFIDGVYSDLALDL
jgi:hypothetical protein